MQSDITIGIPTHKRPKLLERAIFSIIQKKHMFKIIISIDGKDEFNEDYQIIKNKYKNFKNIKFIFHEKKIGSLQNFLYLLDICDSKYFMWLADDDETSAEGIIKLKNILEERNDVVTAVMNWELINEKKEKKLLVPWHFENKNFFKKIIKYSYNADDAFFYGLHRTLNLKKCKFNGYIWPNLNSMSNWCYVFQFDLILQGNIALLNDKDYKWTNHDYGNKYYPRSSTKFLFKIFCYIARRLNIYCLYLAKLFVARKYFVFLIMILVYPFLFFRDIFFKEPAYYKVQFSEK